MTIAEITIANIIERCEMLSAFEGTNAVSGSGESLFTKVRIADRDHALIREYIDEAVKYIEASLGSLDNEVEEHEGGYTLTISKDIQTQRKASASLIKNIEEATASYALMRWLEDKLPERSGSYKSVYMDMLEAVKKLAYKIPFPVKKKRSVTTEVDSVEFVYGNE